MGVFTFYLFYIRLPLVSDERAAAWCEERGGQYQDVMVLYNGDSDERAAAWCEERGWQYLDGGNIYGCEAQCVVLLNCPLWTEFITRARNMLIMLNT